jgi:hypothetical protein
MVKWLFTILFPVQFSNGWTSLDIFIYTRKKLFYMKWSRLAEKYVWLLNGSGIRCSDFLDGAQSILCSFNFPQIELILYTSPHYLLRFCCISCIHSTVVNGATQFQKIQRWLEAWNIRPLIGYLPNWKCNHIVWKPDKCGFQMFYFSWNLPS